MKDILIPEIIEQKIYLIRDQKVMLDSDLAKLYGVTTFRLNEQIKRNKKRFPEDFMFRLNREENIVLTSQIAISKNGRGGRRTLPYAFTEQGVVMLRSKQRTGHSGEYSNNQNFYQAKKTFIDPRGTIEKNGKFGKEL